GRAAAPALAADHPEGGLRVLVADDLDDLALTHGRLLISTHWIPRPQGYARSSPDLWSRRGSPVGGGVGRFAGEAGGRASMLRPAGGWGAAIPLGRACPSAPSAHAPPFSLAPAFLPGPGVAPSLLRRPEGASVTRIILVVDDELDLVSTCERLLHRAGHS